MQVALIGASSYLLMQGAGRHFLPLPTPPFMLGVQSWLEEQPRQRAQAIMRVLTGATMLYLGVYFKVFQPNLVLGIISMHHVPVMSTTPETFALPMALVEVSVGILIIAASCCSLCRCFSCLPLWDLRSCCRKH